MLKIKQFRINPDTLAAEEIKTTFRDYLRRFSWSFFVSILMGAGAFLLFVLFIPSPRERVLQKKLETVKAQATTMDEEISQLQMVLNDLQARDNNLYRALLQAEPIPIEVRLGAVRPDSYYDSIAAMTDMQMSADLTRKLDVLRNEMYNQTKSYDELIALAQNQGVRLECVPAIQPVLNQDLTRFASGYGWRIDPVYGTRRFHEGIDFTAPTGTDVYATGNGKVIDAGWMQGYGNCIDVDHGFDYVTRYAHLNKILVKKGQSVKRGEIIGLVGSTGKSTGPHLHYEVHYKGKPVDPRNFYFLDLTPEEYDQMIQILNNAGNMLD